MNKKRNEKNKERGTQSRKPLRSNTKYSFHPDIEKFAGMIPKEVEVRKEYYEHLEQKHK